MNTLRKRNQKTENYTVVNFLDLDPKKFTFSEKEKSKHNCFYNHILYEGKNLFVKYERRICPFGVYTNMNEKGLPKFIPVKPRFSTSISCEKDYENDPYHRKAKELDEFFIKTCSRNKKITDLSFLEKELRGCDEKGFKGFWKRLLKWSYKADEDIGERVYLVHPPLLEFSVPSFAGKLKPAFFDSDGEKMGVITSDKVDSVLPRFTKASVAAQWSAITHGAFGITIQPKAFHIKIHGNDRPRADKSLFESDEE